jgi:HAD superfamily hydrolase (TIGR01549 family)
VEGVALRRVLDRLGPFAPLIFDLDGTLVRLEVDWGEAQAALARIARRFGRTTENLTVWQMLREASESEAPTFSAALERYEIAGAARARPLPLADVLTHLTGKKVGVVTLNSHACAEEALRVTGLIRHVETIVAREDAPRMKPDPEPLHLCIKRLGGQPAGAVFVGDRERDRETAEAAGTAYLSVEDLFS